VAFPSTCGISISLWFFPWLPRVGEGSAGVTACGPRHSPNRPAAGHRLVRPEAAFATDNAGWGGWTIEEPGPQFRSRPVRGTARQGIAWPGLDSGRRRFQSDLKL
jgi:hypothetical protein